MSRTYHRQPETLLPSMSHRVGLEGLIQMTLSLLASVIHPAEYACGFLGDGPLHPPLPLFLCPKVTVGISLWMP